MIAPYSVKGDEFVVEKPRPWLGLRYQGRGPNRMFDIHPDGTRVPGVYRPFTNKSFNVGKGANTVTVAATGRRGKRLAPGTYLLTVESGGVSARTKLWVLAN